MFCRHGVSSHKHFVRRLFPPHHCVVILLTLHNLSVELGQTDFLWRRLPKLLWAVRMIRVRGSSAAGGLRVRLGERAQVRIERCALQVLGKSAGKGSDSVGNSTNPGHSRPNGAVKQDRDDVFAKKKSGVCVCFFLTRQDFLLWALLSVSHSFFYHTRLLCSFVAVVLLCPLCLAYSLLGATLSHIYLQWFFFLSHFHSTLFLLGGGGLRWQSRQRSANSLKKCEWDTFERKKYKIPPHHHHIHINHRVQRVTRKTATTSWRKGKAQQQ